MGPRSPSSDSRLPEVSILIPVRDGAGYVNRCLTSVLSQTVREIEVVVVDDGSQDRTADLVERWRRRDPRVRLTRQDRSGICAALERGRIECRAPLIARFDIDDVMHRRRIERQVERMARDPELGLVGCQVRYFPRRAVRGGARRYERWLNGRIRHDEIVRDLFVECPIAHPTFLLRADLLADVGGYREVAWPEDYDLVFRLWEAGARFETVDEVLHKWREHPGRLSRTHERYRLERFRECKIHYLRRTLLARGQPVVVWGSGPTGKATARALRRSGAEIRAFVDVDPRKVGQTVHGVPVWSAEQGADARECFGVACVSGMRGREAIREFLRSRGWKEMEEFVAMA